MSAQGAIFRKLLEGDTTKNIHMLTDFLYSSDVLQSDILLKDLSLMFMCAEVKMMLLVVNSFHMSKSSDHIMYLDTICDSLRDHLTFLRKHVPGVQELDELKIFLDSLTTECKNRESWHKWTRKLYNLLTNLLPLHLKGQVFTTLSQTSSLSDYIPLAVTLPHLEQFFSSEAASGNHGSHDGILALDNCLVSSHYEEIFSRLRTSKTTVLDFDEQSKLVSSWKTRLRSLESLIMDAYLKPSKGTQTDIIKKRSQSVLTTISPDFRPSLLSLTSLEDDFLADVVTPPPSPENALAPPLESDMISVHHEGVHNISLSSTTDSTLSRTRIPWTMAESLTLWHVAHQSERPSWSLIWRRYFQSSRRTQVDLKDRWRVICRNQALQAHIRRLYSDWLKNHKSKTVHTPF